MTTEQPTPVPEWHKQLSRILLENHMPTEDEIHRYAVAWGESEVKHLTDWRYWEKLQDDLLEVVRHQAHDIEELEMQLRNVEPYLYVDEKQFVEDCREAYAGSENDCERLIEIIDRLTGKGPRP